MTVEGIRSDRKKKSVGDWRNIDDKVKKEVGIVAEATQKEKAVQSCCGEIKRRGDKES